MPDIRNNIIYDVQTGGAPIRGWTETHPSVSVIGGIVNVLLGSIRSLDDPDGDGDPSDAVEFDASRPQRYLGITIGDGPEMVPRHLLVPSFHARKADVIVQIG